MTKDEIKPRLIENHKKFTSYIGSLDDEIFMFSLNNEKWTAGQQIDHIYRAVKPLNTILSFPKWLVKMVCKKANRPSRKYDELVTRYHQKLQTGGKASGRFLPEKLSPSQKALVIKKVEKAVNRLCRLLDKYSESEMDKLVLPHPLLGRITLREMMFFTIYHVEHHQQIAAKNAAGKTKRETAS